jgi:protein O-GlcNAc transferase
MVHAGIAEPFSAGVAHHRAGRLAEAEACYRQVLDVQPDHADALHLLGVAAHQAGRHELAVDLIGRAIAQNGTNPIYFSNLGCALRDLGRRDEAVAAFHQAIRIGPDTAEAYCSLGVTLRQQGKLDESIMASRTAIRIKPDFAQAYLSLGAALRDQGKFDEALAAYHKANEIKPDLVEARYNLGNALKALGRFDEAVAAYRHAIRIQPGLLQAHCNLGNVLCDLGRPDEAVAAFCQALRIKPDHSKAHLNLGGALLEQGKFDEATAAFRAIRFTPDFAEASSNLAFSLNLVDDVSVGEMFETHRAWDARHGRGRPGPDAHANDRSIGRRLKVGYVSPDFRLHSVAYFLEPLLRSHDRNEVEVSCYSEVSAPDAATERFKELADHWVATVGMSDDALTDSIRNDGIDILVDLAGHTAKNRLPVFARKPAPVQVTWLGYPNTTGLAAMDYRLVDAVTDPEGEADAFASEVLMRLPGGFLCYGARDDAPAPGTAPCLTTGFVTFGSFNNIAKLSGATLDVWARLLTRLPTARLLLKGKPFAEAATRAIYLDRLAERGVAADRIELVAWLPERAHLALYDRADIALDPFPYNGTTTTCEALWMGVPVVTLRGDRHAGRVGASLLTQVGLTDLIADSPEAYVETAVALAGDPARLAELRHSLRPRMVASPLCDAPAFARKIEAAYRTMWQRWCEAHSAAGSALKAGQ